MHHHHSHLVHSWGGLDFIKFLFFSWTPCVILPKICEPCLLIPTRRWRHWIVVTNKNFCIFTTKNKCKIKLFTHSNQSINHLPNILFSKYCHNLSKTRMIQHVKSWIWRKWVTSLNQISLKTFSFLSYYKKLDVCVCDS